MSKPAFLLVLGLCSLLLSAESCKTPAKLSKTNTQQQVDSSRKTSTTAAGMTALSGDAQKALANRLQQLSQATLPFRTLSAKAKMRYEQADDSKEFTAHLRIDSGKAIWVNITALGGMVNVGRALITPDSIRFVNYLQQEAILLPFSASDQLLPVSLSFDQLQTVLVGRAPQLPDAVVSGLQVDSAAYQLSLSGSGLYQVNTFAVADTTLQAYEISRTGSAKDFILQVLLRDLSGEPASRFAMGRTIHVLVNEKKSIVNMDLENVQWNGALNMPFSVPKSYNIR